MADTTIEWSEKVWNPTRGCDVYSKECTNCYAMRFAHRFAGDGGRYEGLTKLTKGGPVWTGEVRTIESQLRVPYQWRAPVKIFVDSMSDLFYGDAADHQRAAQRGVTCKPVPDDFIVECFKVMDETPHTYQVLTKRADRMFDVIARRGIKPLPNVLLGCSAGTQAAADQRRSAMKLLAGMGWRTWVSYEPALELVRWDGWEFITWLVAGSESGYGRRGSSNHWFQSAREWCARSGVAFFMKQIVTVAGVKLPFAMFPKPLQVREYPSTKTTGDSRAKAHT